MAKTKVDSGAPLARLLGVSVLTAALVMPALADKSRPAPIRFGGQGSATAPSYYQPDAASRLGGDDKTARVAVIYPGSQPAESQQVASVPSYQSFDPLGEAIAADTRSRTSQTATSTIQSEDMAPIRITAKAAPVGQPVGRPLSTSSVEYRSGASIADETGYAGVYGDGFNGQPTANGETFDDRAMTAAHPSLPLPSLVQVINRDNGREVVVRVNDRGPFQPGRMIDLSKRAAGVLGIDPSQQAAVTLRYLGPAPVKTLGGKQAERPKPVAPQPLAKAPSQTAAITPAVTQLPLPSSPVNVAPQSIQTGAVYIQVGSFTDIANAEKMNSALGRQLPVNIEQALVNDSNYFRVLVGPFDNRHEAEVYQRHIDDAGIVSGFIVER